MSTTIILLLSVLLNVSGIGFLIYAVTLFRRLNEKIRPETRETKLDLILVLIYLFIVGYGVHLIYFLWMSSTANVHDLLICSIFFFGAIFVVTSLNENFKLIYKLAEKSSRLEDLNKELHLKTEELSKSEDGMKKRSAELENTLEDFYTMRLGMEDQVKRGVLAEENKKMKDRLDALKMK